LYFAARILFMARLRYCDDRFGASIPAEQFTLIRRLSRMPYGTIQSQISAG
jgi:hypothetical protein